MSSVACLVPVARTKVVFQPQDETMLALPSHPQSCADNKRNVRSGCVIPKGLIFHHRLENRVSPCPSHLCVCYPCGCVIQISPCGCFPILIDNGLMSRVCHMLQELLAAWLPRCYVVALLPPCPPCTTSRVTLVTFGWYVNHP